MRRCLVVLLALAVVLQSCTRAVEVPLNDPDAIDRDATYRVVTVDGREFKAKDLAIEISPSDGAQTITFFSIDQSYSFRRSEIKSVQKIETDKSQTGLSVALIVVLAAAGLLLLGEWINGIGD